jgi:hypothetical protein
METEGIWFWVRSTNGQISDGDSQSLFLAQETFSLNEGLLVSGLIDQVDE